MSHPVADLLDLRHEVARQEHGADVPAQAPDQVARLRYALRVEPVGRFVEDEQRGHGQVWWADLDKIRPVVILTRERVASGLTRVLVAPITTVARSIPTEVSLRMAEGVKDGSVANLDNVQLIPVDRLLRRAGRIAPKRWTEFCAAMVAVMD